MSLVDNHMLEVDWIKKELGATKAALAEDAMRRVQFNRGDEKDKLIAALVDEYVDGKYEDAKRFKESLDG